MQRNIVPGGDLVSLCKKKTLEPRLRGDDDLKEVQQLQTN